MFVDGDVLEPFRQVGGEPGEGGVSDANGLQTAEEDGVIDVSKAALRSRRRRMVREPESEESKKSLGTSVLWWERKPDWNVSYRLLERRYCLSCVATALSSSFERNVRLEMGLKLLGSSGSRPGFLRRGVTAGSLRGGGTVPELGRS